jgi:hypothetical protein
MTSSRHRALQGLLFLALMAGTGTGAAADPPGRLTQNVILVTLDGVRVQEIFGGLDESIAAHDEKQVYSEIATARERYSGSTPQARRQALMPFFWNSLAPMGMVLGNPVHDNHVRVQNRVLWSTPGYTEMMTGAPRADVTDNDGLRHAYPTALEYARQALGLGFADVAQIGSWEGFSLAASSRDDAFLMVGAYDAVPEPWATPETDYLADLRRQVMGLWEEGSNDAITFRMAMSFLQAKQPRVLWLALVNSDDWAHADRYDRYLEYLHLADSFLQDLWQIVESMDAYRGKTTVLITTDHGRGRKGDDWAEHDAAIPGSDDIWLAVIGPDTPDLGEVTTSGTIYQGQVAATLLAFLGLEMRTAAPDALAPVPGVLQPRAEDSDAR